MNLLISNDELSLLKSRDFVPLKCENCNIVFNKTKNNVLSSLKGHPDFALRFCSLNCHYANQIHRNWIKIKCAECNIEIKKQKSKIKNNKNNFCSKSCSAKFQNKNKTLGKSKKSKAESYLADLIRKDFKELLITENVRDILPSKLEIDIYISQIRLAIEINGPLHYYPIYGKEKLKTIKDKDKKKKSDVQRINCQLLIFNISKIKYWKETEEFLQRKYLKVIKPLIDGKLKALFSV